MAQARISRDLLRLAYLYGVQVSYTDGFGQRRRPSEEGLLAILNAMSAGLDSVAGARDAARRKQAEIASQVIEPVTVSWSGDNTVLRFKLPAELPVSAKLSLRIFLKDGGELRYETALRDIAITGDEESEGVRYAGFGWRLSDPIANGVHRLRLEARNIVAESFLVQAPKRAADLPEIAQRSRWGMFLPTYAIRTENSSGMGDLSSLRELIGLAKETGAGAVGTLPLLPAFPDDPSPYAPVSRLFWNELYVDPMAAPEFGECDKAKEIACSDSFIEQAAALDRSDTVDYEQQYMLRRPVLEALAEFAFSSPRIRAEIEHFRKEQPAADSYARFRAACEQLGRPWQSWPIGQSTDLTEGEHFDPAAYRYYLNSQRLAFDQVRSLSPNDDNSPALYLDMPLGVRADGFDAWQSPGLFAEGVSAGAPPDAFFTAGQKWGFPPLTPEASRKDGYSYVRQYISHIARHAGIMRIDHVMGLHRLFWVPEQMPGSEGAYVKYPAEELYALLKLESQKHNVAVIGEDLGTVPSYVGPAMRRHNLHRMYAAYFNISPGGDPEVTRPEKRMVASVNTHDMPTFAAFVDGLDIDDRKELGLLTESEAEAEKEQRQQAVRSLKKQLITDGFLASSEDDRWELLRALTLWMAESDAAFVLVNLEDLWLDERPQNTPGTTTERVNWRGRARLSLGQFLKEDHILRLINEL